MAYTPIDPLIIKVGDPITKNLWDLIKNNFDDHEERIQTISGGSGKISLINESLNIGSNGNLTGVIFYEVIQSCLIVEGSIRLFSKSPATSGVLEIDVKKNTTTNPTGFNSIFSIKPSLTMATSIDYQKNVGTINPANQSLLVGDIIRLDITSLPSGLQNFRVNLIGEF